MSTPIISVDVKGVPDLQAALRRSADLATPLLHAATRGVQNAVVRHLRVRNARPTRPGWPKSDYWAEAADSVRAEMRAKSSTVVIGGQDTPGLRLHLMGGVVKPKAGKKALAIPVRPEVAGIWPSEYDTGRLFLIVKKALGKAWLAQRDKNGHITVLWRLVRQTRHIADPSVLPTDADLGNAAQSAIADALRGLAAGGNTP